MIQSLAIGLRHFQTMYAKDRLPKNVSTLANLFSKKHDIHIYSNSLFDFLSHQLSIGGDLITPNENPSAPFLYSIALSNLYYAVSCGHDITYIESFYPKLSGTCPSTGSILNYIDFLHESEHLPGRIAFLLQENFVAYRPINIDDLAALKASVA